MTVTQRGSGQRLKPATPQATGTKSPNGGDNDVTYFLKLFGKCVAFFCDQLHGKPRRRREN